VTVIGGISAWKSNAASKSLQVGSSCWSFPKALAACMGLRRTSKPTEEVDPLASLEPPPLGEDDEPEERNPFINKPWVGTAMKRQPKTLETLGQSSLRTPQGGLVHTEQHEVVHVAHVTGAAELALHTVIDRVQVDVRPELAGEIADGKATRAIDREEIVSREVDHVVHLVEHATATRQDQIDQPEDHRVLYLLSQNLPQDRVVDAWKELAEVELEDKREPARELLAMIERSVGSLASSIREALRNEAALEERLDEVAEGVMDDSVAERCRADQAALGLVDEEAAVASGSVRPFAQLGLQCNQVIFEAMLEGSHIGVAPLASARLAPGEEEVSPRGESLEQSD
jgi:hypothetical protein